MKKPTKSKKLELAFGLSDLDREEKLRRIILVRILLFTCVAGLVWSALYIFLELYLGAFAVAGYAILSILNLGYYRITKRYKTFRLVQLILILFLPVGTQLALGSFISASGVMLAALLCPLGALMFHSAKTARILFFCFVGALAAVGIYETIFPQFLKDVDRNISVFFFVMNFASISAIVYFLLEYFVDQRSLFQALLKERNKEITDSIKYAKRIQDAIIPTKNRFTQEIPSNFILFKPKDIVAGDFYWMETVESRSLQNEVQGAAPSIVFFAAADCTGHGVPGAMVSVVCVNALNRCVREFGLREPSKILDKTRDLVMETFEKSENNVSDGMDISICKWDKQTNILNWSGANNSLYIIRTNGNSKPSIIWKIKGETQDFSVGQESISGLKTMAGSNNTLFEILSDKQPIGPYPNQKPFTNHEIQLEKGDMLYVFTDGFADQFGGEKGKKFKYNNFKKMLLEMAKRHPQEQVDFIEEFFEDWKGDFEQIDDVCIIGVRV